jgi:hypothetical protein
MCQSQQQLMCNLCLMVYKCMGSSKKRTAPTPLAPKLQHFTFGTKQYQQMVLSWIRISNLKLHLHSSQSMPNLQFPDVLHPQVGHGICLIAMRQVERTIKIYSFWPCPIFCLEKPHLLHRTLKSTWDQQTTLSEPVKAPAQDNSPIYGKLGHRPLARSTDIGLDKIKQ